MELGFQCNGTPLPFTAFGNFECQVCPRSQKSSGSRSRVGHLSGPKLQQYEAVRFTNGLFCRPTTVRSRPLKTHLNHVEYSTSSLPVSITRISLQKSYFSKALANNFSIVASSRYRMAGSGRFGFPGNWPLCDRPSGLGTAHHTLCLCFVANRAVNGSYMQKLK